MREQLINILANGSSREDAKKIIGCSDDYINDCLADKTFLDQIREKRDGIRQELIEQGYAKLEQSTINSLKKDVDNDFVDAAAKCRILEAVAKNRILHRNPAGHFTNPTANFIIEVRYPQAAQSQGLVIDQKTNQIVAIGDRNMSGMPIQGVQKLFQQIEHERLTSRSARATIDADLNTHEVSESQHGNQENETDSVARAA